ncbi:MAG: ABC transporter ATP-binding protein [Candidatus Sumerlaeaceae bacterium]
MKSLLRLRCYVAEHRWRIAGGFVCLVLTNYFQLRVARVVGEASDAVLAGGHTRNDFAWFAGFIVLLTVGVGVARYYMRTWIIGASRDIELKFRDDLFAKLQSLSPSFYDHQRTGDLMARATNDVDQVRSFIGPGFLQFFNSVILFPLAVGRMISIDVRLALLTMAPLLSLPFIMNYFGNRVHRRFRNVQDHYSHISAMVQENLAGVRVVRAFVQEEAEKKKFAALNEQFIRLNLHLARIQSGFYPSLRALAGTSIVLLLWIGGNEVMRGNMSVGKLVEFSMIQTMLFWPMIALGWTVSLMQRGAASMDRIAEILDLAPDVPADTGEQSQAGVSTVSDRGGCVEFRNLSFSYSSDLPPALRDIKLRIPAGSRLGVVGSTGSGKSTLASLLLHLYPVDRGKLFIDGEDLSDIPMDVLRDRISLVFQETFLFSDTIENNIAFGEPDATMEQIENVAMQAHLAPEIELFPKKYATVLGERGINLSGGQKQRTAIARALLRDPDILVLDDALSAVDTETEARILDSLVEVLEKRTAIVIAHRVSAVMHCDHIIVLEEGAIVEQGSHDQLLAHGGIYADLFEKQQLSDAVELDAS